MTTFDPKGLAARFAKVAVVKDDHVPDFVPLTVSPDERDRLVALLNGLEATPETGKQA